MTTARPVTDRSHVHDAHLRAKGDLVAIRVLNHTLGDASEDSQGDRCTGASRGPHPGFLRCRALDQGEDSERGSEPQESSHRTESEAHDGEESDHLHMLLSPTRAATDRPPDG